MDMTDPNLIKQLVGWISSRVAKVDAGSATFRGVLLLLAACLRAGVPVLLENPASSMAWSHPTLSPLLARPSCRISIVD
eukprot:7264661-Pyramimonas_sp.AAC.1